ncbi:bifunctional 5,10-methylenetetrahydrofolate dehydrogenase/5,10-methenyltetrahydrofolate cyclohydrolase [Candidatus Uhrbacteria bacterium]|nr:bifunctional 5,10-methylenetetrahydrofolate dehydrogenase/5,10-methenyltetrahydrofolate cyclohydrolase [Candidatus Uhrbacteria bacterium]
MSLPIHPPEPLVLRGEPVVARVYEELQRCIASRVTSPRLVAILANDREESRTYLRKKAEAAARVGMRFDLLEMPRAEWTTAACIHRLTVLNRDPDVHGVIMQLPLAEGIDSDAVLAMINPRKDVDGMHPANTGASLLAFPGLRPATAKAIIALLAHYDIPLAGKRAVIVGRSRIVGKPLIGMLLEANATVTICHRQTRDLASETLRAELLIVATGTPGLITADMVADGAVVVDTGWSRIDGKIRGDVDPVAFARTRAYAPVPGGVGPVTVAMLLANTVEAWLLQEGTHRSLPV